MVLKDTNVGRLILEQIATEKTASVKTERTYSPKASKISDGLFKIASLPYKEEVYNSVQEVMKIASKCINELSSSLKQTESKNSELEKAAEVRVIIDDMIRLGAIDEYSVEEKVAELITKDSHHLEIVKEAVKMSQGVGGGGRFFEFEKEASVGTDSKSGMFDEILS